VAIGYVVVLRVMGVSPAFPLVIAMCCFWWNHWLARRSGKKAKTGG